MAYRSSRYRKKSEGEKHEKHRKSRVVPMLGCDVEKKLIWRAVTRDNFIGKIFTLVGGLTNLVIGGVSAHHAWGSAWT
jgi:hypothetical protein